MAEYDALNVMMWGRRIGVVVWDDDAGVADFQYDPDYLASGLEISPLAMPLRAQPYRFPRHSNNGTFSGMPGLLADSLPESYGNAILEAWLARRGIAFGELTPVERLGYLGSRGMGALEFFPDLDPSAGDPFATNVDSLVQVAKEVLNSHAESRRAATDEDNYHHLVQVGTSAGGAKAKAIVAFNESTNEMISGQVPSPPGFDHWILKLASVENSEHLVDQYVGHVEYAYYLMAVDAGITMMESRLVEGDGSRHFMTRRFDRIDGTKIHYQSLCGIAHVDRNPPGAVDYQTLFLAARRLGLGQESLTELYRRMVFNVLARNQDDHPKNHGFLMDQTGSWIESPAFDLTFSYRKDSRWISAQQMRCNGKRDDFVYEDLTEAAKGADVRRPKRVIDEVRAALDRWPHFAERALLPPKTAAAIQEHFRNV